MRYTVDIPGTFETDHRERDLPCGRFVKNVGRSVRYECTAEELEEWLSDADYYSDCAGQGWDMGETGPPLQRSARATYRRVKAVLDNINGKETTP